MDRDELEDARDELLEDNEDDLEYHITFPSPTLNSDLSPSRWADILFLKHACSIIRQSSNPEPCMCLT